MSDDTPEIKVFGNDDESLKILGHLLSNKTSRMIIQCITDKEMYLNEIAKKCNIQMNVAQHHVKKLEAAGLVTVTKKSIMRKGADHKFYKMIPNVFVNATQTKEEMHKSGLFKRIFKETVKFSAIIISFVFSSLWYEFFSIKGSEITSFTIPVTILLFGFIVHTIFHSRPRKRKHN